MDLASMKHESEKSRRPVDGDTAAAPLGILVVTHNSVDTLREFFAAQVGVARALNVPLLTIDNASDDGTVAFLEQHAGGNANVDVLLNPTNRGYAAAVNQGFDALPGRDVLVINPDIALFDVAQLRSLTETLANNPRAAVVAPRLLSTDGSRQASARRFPCLLAMAGHSSVAIRFGPTQRATQTYLELPPNDRTTKVDWVIGAAMLIRRDAFDAVGGFDERYFLYLEDTDFCLRCAQQGWETLYVPHTALRHVHSRASNHARGGVLVSSARRHHVVSMVRFFLRYPHLIRGAR